jgi:hypothetical protein
MRPQGGRGPEGKRFSDRRAVLGCRVEALRPSETSLSRSRERCWGVLSFSRSLLQERTGLASVSLIPNLHLHFIDQVLTAFLAMDAPLVQGNPSTWCDHRTGPLLENYTLQLPLCPVAPVKMTLGG